MDEIVVFLSAKKHEVGLVKGLFTSGNSCRIASSAAALALSILDGDEGEAPRQETFINLIMPPCSLAICT